MEKGKIRSRLDPVDHARRDAISALSFYGFYITEHCDIDSELHSIPAPNIEANSWYFYLVHLLADMGIYWLRDTMRDWGHTMPEGIYNDLSGALLRVGEQSAASYPEVFAGQGSDAELMWSGHRFPRNGIIALEFLRKFNPEYYEIVVKVLCGLLLHYGKYWGIPHYRGRYTHREGACGQSFSTEDLEVADWGLSPGTDDTYQYVGFRKGDYIKCAGCGVHLHVDKDFTELPFGKGRGLVPRLIPPEGAET